MNRSGSVQSVDRAVQILQIVERDGEAVVADVARELGVHSSTVSRLISALEAHELVERANGSRRVHLGVGLLRLAGSSVRHLDIATKSQPVCDVLADELGETINVAVLSGDTAVNVCQAHGTSTVAMHNWVGHHTVLHATSSGKVLLAYLDQARRDALTRGPRERFTDRTLVSDGALVRELEAVRTAGWASAVEEFEEGLNAVAAPIYGFDGSVLAAISAAGPTYRLSPERLPEAAQALVGAADTVSRSMGRPSAT